MEKPYRISFYGLTLIITSLVLSCGNKRQNSFQSENQITFDTIRSVSRRHLMGDSSKPFCDIQIKFVYPVSSRKSSLDTLQQFFVRSLFGTAYETLQPNAAVEAYTQSYIDNYLTDARTYSQAAVTLQEQAPPPTTHIEVVNPGQDEFYSYHEVLSDSILYNQYGILTFQVKQSNNKGGANAYHSYRNYVFNLNNNRQVTENELFNGGYDTALQHLIIASLLEQNNVKRVEELEDLGYFGIREIVPNKNFLLNREGIIYTFNKGEYSAYQLDAPEVFIPYNAIRSLLREQSVAAKLAHIE